ncbi:YebC/PmpR family DNA-binding transcriptional regulator [Corynebacterium pseudodiphtheriticum]|uniref:YebC/PmpR family DNA-binding transcriptional regulator n=1 Tax=Corynebacterium pseudodiphtheriticum TaxID=37637 RepID=UPI00254D0B80|nr:YebC/PmpR family DNA-binding transcriptional regulator [Corynebacterium pseudodiphtheriticum]MDK8477455.1 YebC/PmpR family DNA-binding transcriptional regulator [Corynebacterium pseudodiphtheriticum]MDK8485761.1 YebC/PmpR family DNA-binding transcriptional regulator [Corynebacterium pseudodiphtheriticum]MDK8492994.1 YebC/PmpR family DNA-binding transcriptional regulator [Corynebacterium pseudodiphtheriticum]MDK8500021.1 YebC/PmpR family DNA-binding transcriptional regulator [Corynebacterium 
MAGHSKWANNKHKKAANDAKRGKEFAKLVKNIEVAARNGGGDPAANPTLDDMIKKAKKASVPADNIERARKRGSGEEAGGADWQSLMYEGYAPNGVAMLIECLTDNKNRAATEVRTAMTKNGGNLGESGSVAYMFSRTGYVLVDKKSSLTEDELLLAVLEAGAEEVKDQGEKFEVICQPTDVPAVRSALEEAGIEVEDSDQDFRASVDVPLDAEGAKKVFKLIDALEDVDDVQDVYTNMTVSDEVMEELNS